MTDASDSRSGAFPSQVHQLPALTSGIVSGKECSLDANSNAIVILPLPPRPLAPQHGRTSSTQSQDKAIYDFWKRGTNPEHIMEYVATYREIERTGNQHDLAIMAKIPAEQLAERIFNVVNRSTPSLIGEAQVINHTVSVTELEPPLTYSRMPAEAKRKGPSAKAKIKRSNKPNPYECSGYGDKCLERKNRQWRSKFEFWLHFETHLKDGEALDGYICLQCGMESQSPDIVCTATEKYSHGRELAMHIWFEHMIPSTRPKRPHGAALAAVDGRE